MTPGGRLCAFLRPKCLVSLGGRLRLSCATCPAVPAALALAAGILAGVSWGGPSPSFVRGAIALLLGGAVCGAAAPWRGWRLLLLPLGACLALLHEKAPWDTLERRVPRPACRVAVRAVVVDSQCHDEALDVLPPPDAAVVSLRGLRLPGQAEWLRVRGRAVLLLPEGCPVAYGDCIVAEGVLLPAERVPFRGAYDHAASMRRSGVRHTLRAERIRREGSAGGLAAAAAGLLALRDVAARRLTAHIPSDENARILLAMTFGFRQALGAETRDAFLRSGAIHVFSVSGLHVVIVATVIGAILSLSGLGYRWRYGALPALLGAYVVMTGSAPSAVRAWLMVSVLCLGRAWFLTFAPLNGVALAALVLLLWRPLALFQAGFQYSFVTASVLVLGWPLVTEFSRDLTERALWLPAALRPRRRLRAVRWVAGAVGGSLLAWAAGAGLMLYLSAMVVPAAVPVNLVLVLAANLVLVLAVPKILLACLPAALPDALAGRFLSAAVSLIGGLVRLGSRPAGSWSVPPPPAFFVVAYYAAFAAVFLPRLPGRWRLAGACLAGSVLTAGAACGLLQRPCTALVWGGDCDVPVVVMERHDGLPPVVVHSGTPGAHRALAGWLQHRGYRRVDLLVFALDHQRAVQTAPLAVRRLGPGTLLVPVEPRPGSYLARACALQRAGGGRVRVLAPSPDTPGELRAWWPGGLVTVTGDGQNRRVTIATEGAGPPQTVAIERLESGRCRVTLAEPGAPPRVLEVCPGFHRRVIRLSGLEGPGEP